MARTVDKSKIENIKKAVITLVVSRGYSNTSTAMIAKESGVSEGYLYRYYKSKYDLVRDVLSEHTYEIIDSLNYLIENSTSFETIVTKLVKTMFVTANIYPDKIKFLYILMHDYSFEETVELREKIYESCSNVITVGKNEGFVRDDVTLEEIFQMGILYPIEFINLRMKGMFHENDIKESDVNKTIQFILNSIR